MRRSCRPLERVGRNRSQLRDEISRRFSGLKANNVLEFLFIASFSYVRDRTREYGFTREFVSRNFKERSFSSDLPDPQDRLLSSDLAKPAKLLLYLSGY